MYYSTPPSMKGKTSSASKTATGEKTEDGAEKQAQATPREEKSQATPEKPLTYG